jgi:hypothetical protein
VPFFFKAESPTYTDGSFNMPKAERKENRVSCFLHMVQFFFKAVMTHSEPPINIKATETKRENYKR